MIYKTTFLTKFSFNKVKNQYTPLPVCYPWVYGFITKNAFIIKIIIKFLKLQQRTQPIFSYFFIKHAVTASINLSIVKILNILYLKHIYVTR